MQKDIVIGNKKVGKEHPTFIIAEMSANHNMDFERAKKIIEAAKSSGADAIKLQTYTPDTITIDCREEWFMTQSKIWEGMTLYELYQKAYTPWEWHEELKRYANELGLEFFSSPFDTTAVDFLEELEVPAYKISSYEINDIPLVRKIVRTGKPIIISTGIAYAEDIQLIKEVCKEEGNDNIIFLKCVSAYPVPFDEMNLGTIPNMIQEFSTVVGLSDHSLGDEAAIASVALGARVIEKHLTLRRADGGPDSTFSMEPEEFAEMVCKIRNIERALGVDDFGFDETKEDRRKGSRSLFVVEDIKEGDALTEKNIRSIRPGIGMHTKNYEKVLGRTAKCDIKRGTPLDWKYI